MAGRSRRSAARSATSPDDVVFVIDECLGGHLVREALASTGVEVKLVREEFGEGALDLEWLPQVGRRGWIVLTKDQRIRRHPVERAAYVEARVRGFFLAAKKLQGPAVADLFVVRLPRMLEIIERYEAPFIAIVRREGLVLYEDRDCKLIRRRRKRR